MTRQFFGLLILGILLAGASGYFLGRSSVNKVVTFPLEGSKDVTLSASLVAFRKNNIDILNQKAGNTVSVNDITLEKTSWLAIHEDNGGKPGNILGARRFPAGVTKNSFIELLRPTVGGVYYAMIHEDDGSPDFDYEKDPPRIGDLSSMMVRFTITD